MENDKIEKIQKSETPINVAVFVDYENVYRALLEKQQNVLHLAFFEKLRKWCADNQRRVVRTVVYCNFDIADLHESYHQSTLQGYGVETVHTSNQGKNYADLKITIDVLTSMYSNDNIDEFFIMSNDKDMTPLLNAIRENKRNAVIITTGQAYNQSLCEFADRHITLEEICDVKDAHRKLDDTANQYWKNFESYVANQVTQYPTTNDYNHYGFDYNLDTQSKYHKIMKYEWAAIIKEFYDAGKVFFYNYWYGKDCYVGMAPTSQKETMVSHGILRENNIIATYNIDKVIGDLYSKALR